MNSNDPRASFNHNTDYVVVARTDGNSRDVTLYNYADGTQHSTASDTDSNTLQSATNGDTKLCMGWSKSQKSNEGFYGSIKGLAVWDTRLTDAEVAALLPNFRSVSGSWVLGSSGAVCNSVCAGQGLSCTPAVQTSLTTCALMLAAMSQAGEACSCSGNRDYAGTPFRTGSACYHFSPGSSATSSCTANSHGHHRPLCYCS